MDEKGNTMDLVYYLNKHSKLSTCLRNIFQPITYPLLGAIVKLAVHKHHLNMVDTHHFQTVYRNRPPSIPLITVANHHSCLDDFLLFGSLLSLSQLTDVKRFRWTLTAVDICYTNRIHSFFFNWGKGIPVWRNVRDTTTKELVIRGGGVDQPSMDFTLDLLNHGEWVHIFPQGRVIYDTERALESSFPFRWGIGRLIAESKVAPIILPIWHRGFEQLNPPDQSNTRNTITRLLGKPRCLTVVVGQPVDFSEIRTRFKNKLLSKQVCQSRFRSLLHTNLTDAVQQTMQNVKFLADQYHSASLEQLNG